MLLLNRLLQMYNTITPHLLNGICADALIDGINDTKVREALVNLHHSSVRFTMGNGMMAKRAKNDFEQDYAKLVEAVKVALDS